MKNLILSMAFAFVASTALAQMVVMPERTIEYREYSQNAEMVKLNSPRAHAHVHPIGASAQLANLHSETDNRQLLDIESQTYAFPNSYTHLYLTSVLANGETEESLFRFEDGVWSFDHPMAGFQVKSFGEIGLDRDQRPSMQARFLTITDTTLYQSIDVRVVAHSAEPFGVVLDTSLNIWTAPKPVVPLLAEVALSEEVTSSPLKMAVVSPSTSNARLTVFPNPARNEAVNLRFDLNETNRVSVDLYDLEGKRLRRIARKQQMAAGTHRINVPTDGLSSGTYLLRLESGQEVLSEKFILTR